MQVVWTRSTSPTDPGLRLSPSKQAAGTDANPKTPQPRSVRPKTHHSASSLRLDGESNLTPSSLQSLLEIPVNYVGLAYFASHINPFVPFSLASYSRAGV